MPKSIAKGNADTGRPVGTHNPGKMAIRTEALKFGRVALLTLVDVCRRGDTDQARVAAANAILDRAYGKPIQSHRVGNLNELPVVPITPDMNEAEAYDLYSRTIHPAEEELASTLH